MSSKFIVRYFIDYSETYVAEFQSEEAPFVPNQGDVILLKHKNHIVVSRGINQSNIKTIIDVHVREANSRDPKMIEKLPISAW